MKFKQKWTDMIDNFLIHIRDYNNSYRDIEFDRSAGRQIPASATQPFISLHSKIIFSVCLMKFKQKWTDMIDNFLFRETEKYFTDGRM